MFKVMTWNVENLFRPGDAGGPTQEVYEAKLDGLAATIDGEAPTAVSLQEIGNVDALADLVARLDGEWHTRVSDHPDGRNIRVAWVTRQPVIDSADIVAFPAQFRPVQTEDEGEPLNEMGRGGVSVAVQADSGATVRLLTCHLKSKLLSFPEPGGGTRFNPRDEDERARYATYALHRRAAEAATMRGAATQALDDAGGDRPLILTGDLNDTVQAATTQLLQGPPGSEIGTGGFGLPDAGDAQRLWNLAPLMPAGKDYSRINRGRKELIDHILVSAALVESAQDVRAVLPEDGGELPSVTEDPGARRNAPSSDHAPVVATFPSL